MLKLQLPRLEQYLRTQTLLFLSTPTPLLIKPGRTRNEKFSILFEKLRTSRKYIFDSGTHDAGPDRESLAIEETAAGMMRANLFRLPVSPIWIEDYFEDDPNNRYDILAYEDEEGAIRFWGFNVRAASGGKSFKSVSAIPVEGVLKSTDQAGMMYYDRHPLLADIEVSPGVPAQQAVFPIPDDVTKLPTVSLIEMAFSLKKFIVCLNSRGIEMEAVSKSVPSRPTHGALRDYAYTIVRVPHERPTTATGRRSPRLHLVAGHLKYRDRPVDQQVWVQPYFRGRGEELPEKTFIVRR